MHRDQRKRFKNSLEVSLKDFDITTESLGAASSPKEHHSGGEQNSRYVKYFGTFVPLMIQA